MPGSPPGVRNKATVLQAKGFGWVSGCCTREHVFVLKHHVDKCRSTRGSRLVFVVHMFCGYLQGLRLLCRTCGMTSRLGSVDAVLNGPGCQLQNVGCVLVSMYWEAPVTVENGTTLGDTLNTSRGVMQGDPVSLLLFGLLLTGLSSGCLGGSHVVVCNWESSPKPCGCSYMLMS